MISMAELHFASRHKLLLSRTSLGQVLRLLRSTFCVPSMWQNVNKLQIYVDKKETTEKEFRQVHWKIKENEIYFEINKIISKQFTRICPIFFSPQIILRNPRDLSLNLREEALATFGIFLLLLLFLFEIQFYNA